MTLTKRYDPCAIARMAGAWLLAAACLLSFWPSPLPASAAVGDGEDSAVAEVGQTQGTTTVSPSALLAALLGDADTVSDAEAGWLDHQSPDTWRAAWTISYDHTVPSDVMRVEPMPDGSRLLSTTPYDSTYNGVTLTWTPTTVTVGTAVLPLAQMGDAYTAVLPDLPDGGMRVTLHFEAAFTIATRDYNALINAAYEAALQAEESYRTYEAALASYEAAEQAYDDYLVAQAQFAADMALYRAYEKELRSYENQMTAYRAYLSDMETYRADLSAYEAYVAEKAAYDEANALYLEFISDPAAYEARYLAYCRWIEEMATVRDQLAVLESCYMTDSVGHVMFNTLKGPTVASVISRKEELVSSGCSELDIDNANRSTDALIRLLTNYPLGGGEAERYAYYIAHYAELKEHFRTLYTSLANLYRNDLVPDILDMQGRLVRYQEFVGHLYVLTCLFDDGEVWQSTWSMAGVPLADRVDACYRLPDRNKATPLAAYPVEVAPVQAPGTIKKPTKPTEVVCPTRPTEVTEPVKPATVHRPTAPKPVPSPDPAARPVAPVYSAELEALRLSLREGTLTRRAESDRAMTYRVTTHLDRSVYAEETLVAQFYAYDRVTIYAELEADAEGHLTLPAAPPAPVDPRYDYTFVGWSYADGTLVTKDTVTVTLTASTVFYPTFTAVTKTHTVTWVVGDRVVTESVAYGSEPRFSGSTAKTPDAASLYEFIGWSPAPSTVTGDVTYTAQYRAIPRTYTVLWQWDGETQTGSYPFGTLPTPDEIPTRPMSGRYAYTFAGWSPEVVPVNGHAVYTAIFEAIDLLPHLPADAWQSVEETDAGWIIRDPGPASAGGTRLTDISRVVGLAAADGASLSFCADGLEVVFPHGAVQAIAKTAAVYLSVERKAQGFLLALYDADHHSVAVEGLAARVTLTAASGQAVRLYRADGSLLAFGEERVSFTATCGEGYTLYYGYAVLVTETSVGLCHASRPLAAEGETVTLTVTAQPGHAFAALTVVAADGTQVAVAEVGNGAYTFVMPAGEVTVTPSFTPCTYRVTFTVDGTVISSETYRYGEMPAVPAIPTRPDDGEYRYEFEGWTPTVTAVLSDVDYEATFLPIPLHYNASVEDAALKLWQATLIGMASYLVATAAILVPFFAVRHRRKGK